MEYSELIKALWVFELVSSLPGTELFNLHYRYHYILTSRNGIVLQITKCKQLREEHVSHKRTILKEWIKKNMDKERGKPFTIENNEITELREKQQ